MYKNVWLNNLNIRTQKRFRKQVRLYTSHCPFNRRFLQWKRFFSHPIAFTFINLHKFQQIDITTWRTRSQWVRTPAKPSFYAFKYRRKTDGSPFGFFFGTMRLFGNFFTEDPLQFLAETKLFSYFQIPWNLREVAQHLWKRPTVFRHFETLP